MKLTFGCEISAGVPFPFFTSNLEDRIDLIFQKKYYGNSILKIYSGFVCVSETFELLHPIRPAKLLRKESALEFEYKLDFETYKNMNDEQRLKYVATEYLKNVKEIFIIKKIKDFDSQHFIDDLELFFRNENLLVEIQ